MHINRAIAKADRRLNIIRRCQKVLPRSCKEMLYKTTIRPVLDYSDIIYDACLKSESDAIEKCQRKAALICTGAFRHTSNERLLNELGCERMERRRVIHRLTLFYKMYRSLTPPYLRDICNLVLHNMDAYNLRRNHSIHIRRELFSKSFYPKTIRKWNNLSLETKGSQSLHIFKENLKRLYGHNISKKLYAHGHCLPAVNHCRMHLGLSHLKNHLFNSNIQSKFCENSNCDLISETSSHFLLFCPRYGPKRHTMRSEISTIIFPGTNYYTIIAIMPDYLCNIILQGSEDLSLNVNKKVFDCVF